MKVLGFFFDFWGLILKDNRGSIRFNYSQGAVNTYQDGGVDYDEMAFR